MESNLLCYSIRPYNVTRKRKIVGEKKVELPHYIEDECRGYWTSKIETSICKLSYPYGAGHLQEAVQPSILTLARWPRGGVFCILHTRVHAEFLCYQSPQDLLVYVQSYACHVDHITFVGSSNSVTRIAKVAAEWKFIMRPDWEEQRACCSVLLPPCTVLYLHFNSSFHSHTLRLTVVSPY